MSQRLVARRLAGVVAITAIMFGASAAAASAHAEAPSRLGRQTAAFALTHVSLHSRYLTLVSKERAEPIAYTAARGKTTPTGGTVAAAACSEPHCPLTYQGGSVQTTPKVYLLLWGPAWSTANSDAQYLHSFYEGLGQQPSDDWSTTMEQYGVQGGGFPTFHGSVLEGVYQDTSTPPYGASQDQLSAEADAFYTNEGLSDPVNTQIVVATQSGTCPSGFYDPSCDPSGYYCAWHSSTSVNGVPFTNLPYVVDAGSGCGEDYVNANGTYDGFSIVGGHEYAETVTDPFPDSGWDDVNDNTGGGEIGDKCAWQDLFDLPLSTGTFAMQPLWSNSADACAQTTSVSVAGAPGIGAATAGNAQATVTFTAPASSGGATIQSYTVTAHDLTNSTRGGEKVSATGSPIVVSGLTNGDSYDFTVVDQNAVGTSSSSGASNTVVPGGGTGGKPASIAAQFITNSIMTTETNPGDPYAISWKQGTCPSGSVYTLAEAINNGTFSTVYTGTGAHTTINVYPGSLYTFAVSCGGASVSTTFRLNGYQQTSAAYTGAWTTTSFSGAWGGTATYTAAANATATFTCTCEALAWVSDLGSNHGSAKVYIDGVLKATISTTRSSNTNRVVVYKYGWSTDGKHTIKIVNLATAGKPRINVDGFLTRTAS
jgi:serine protease